jgi:hypothetical protein
VPAGRRPRGWRDRQGVTRASPAPRSFTGGCTSWTRSGGSGRASRCTSTSSSRRRGCWLQAGPTPTRRRRRQRQSGWRRQRGRGWRAAAGQACRQRWRVSLTPRCSGRSRPRRRCWPSGGTWWPHGTAGCARGDRAAAAPAPAPAAAPTAPVAACRPCCWPWDQHACIGWRRLRSHTQPAPTQPSLPPLRAAGPPPACRPPQVSHEDLGRANSAYMREAARSFIRGSSGDARSGWGSPPDHVTALLCFDEVQVRRPAAGRAGAGAQGRGQLPALADAPGQSPAPCPCLHALRPATTHWTCVPARPPARPPPAVPPPLRACPPCR